MNFEKVYLQKMDGTDSEGNAVSYPLKETIKDFRMYCYAIPFNIGVDAKDLPSYEWTDGDGTDEYVPAVIPMKSYDMEMTFAFKTNSTGEAAVYAKLLRDYLTGRDGTGASLMIYSTYTGIGRRNVRYLKGDNAPKFYKTKQGERLLYKVTVKVSDPVTDVTYNTADGKLENI